MKVSQIVHQIVGAKPSPTVSHCLHSWLKLKDHGFEIYYWNDDRLEIFLEKYHGFAGIILTRRQVIPHRLQ